MSQLVKDRFTRLLDSAIVVVGTKEIVPAMVFKQIGRYSAYVEHYYMHTSHVMILIIEPVSKPWNRAYIPAWREELLDVILCKLASTALVAGEYYTYVHCFMARYFVAIDLLRKLAFALEEGYTFDEEDPDVNVDMHYLFKNFAYGQRMETFFLCSTSERFILLKVNNLFYFYCKFKITIAFLLGFGLDKCLVSLWEAW